MIKHSLNPITENRISIAAANIKNIITPATIILVRVTRFKIIVANTKIIPLYIKHRANAQIQLHIL